MRVKVKLRKKIDSSYEILIERGLLRRIPADLKRQKYGNKYAIVTDKIVERIYGKEMLHNLQAKGINSCLISFEGGEKSKNLRTVEKLLDKMLSNGLDRKSCVIALGGGVVGDIAGFAAASYMRGIPFVQVPTTLLAMVDSSTGGKVGVDLRNGKNSCGAFWQPKRVYVDLAALESLPKREIINGMSEVVKSAIIKDAKLFKYIEENAERILKPDLKVMENVIARSCNIKAFVVERDEYEENLRKIVNYGHTIGHAIEVLTNYRKYTHGEAIAIGMAVEADIARRLGYLKKEEAQRQNNLLRRIGLNTALPRIDEKKILNELRKDKKAVGGRAQFVLPERIGKMKTRAGMYGLNVPSHIILNALYSG